MRKIGPRRQRKPRKKQQQKGSRYIDSQNIISGINLGNRAANTEVGRMIVDDVVGLIPRGYKALKINCLDVKQQQQQQQHLLSLLNQFKHFILETINHQFKYFLLKTIIHK